MQLYLHIPFCKSKCAYCDFNSYACKDEALILRYLTALNHEISLAGKRFAKAKIDTVYIGGGTPSALDENKISSVFDALENSFDLSFVKEFSIECNPESITAEKLALYKRHGVNRISIGVQSLSDENLKVIGRLHDANTAIEKIKLAKEFFDNVSCDLIIGLPIDTVDGIRKEVRTLCPLAEHISMYELSVEKGTRLERMIQNGKVALPSDDDTQTLFDTAFDEAEKLGFQRYEVSNFAKNGKISLHNFGYWTREEYLGLGAGAHSLLKTIDGEKRTASETRYANFSKLDEYCAAVEGNEDYKDIVRESVETLTEKDVKNETIMLGLRTHTGINKDLLGEIDDRLSVFFEEQDGKVRLTRDGVAVMNSILVEILE